jgi:DNA replication protein DnaC
MIDVTCAGCGKELTLEIEGESRWLRMMAQHIHCHECAVEQERLEAERERKAARESRRSRCHLPERLRGQLLEHFSARSGQGAAVAAASEWASQKAAHGLMLTGPTGTGKTSIAAAACWTRLERWPCAYASVARTMARLGASFTDEGRAEAVRVLTGAGAVVLDDLDKCRPTDYGREQLFAAVDAREQAEAPLLVTTNLTPSEIGEQFGDALMSRLAGYCRVVEVGGDDQRLAA